MPQGHPQRRLSQRRRLLLKHRLLKQNQSSKKYAIASWNLRRLGQGGWGETSWLKLKMVTCLMFLFLRGFRFRILITEFSSFQDFVSRTFSREFLLRIMYLELFLSVWSIIVIAYCYFTSCMLYCCGRAFASSNPLRLSRGGYVWRKVLGF